MIETIYSIPNAPHLALLSDLHNRPFAPVTTSLQKHSPDLICITGDVLYGSQPEGNDLVVETQENVLPFLHSCASIAPTYLSLGNHEWMLSEDDTEGIRSTGAIILDNNWTEQDGLVIGGLTSGYVTDYRTFRAKSGSSDRYPRQENISGIGGAVAASRHKPETAWLEEYSSAPGYHILLSHHPEYLPLIPSSIELVLSGHAHGGQWRVFNHGVWAPGQGWWPKWTRGVYEGRLVVSAGLSNTTWIPRIWNPTEVVYIEP